MTTPETKKENILEISVCDVGFSPRAVNCLRYAGVQTVGDLVQKTLNEVARFKHLGRSMLDEIVGKIQSLGLTFKEEEIVEEKEVDSLQNEEFVKMMGFARATFTFFRRNRITRLEQLADKMGEDIFNMRRCSIGVFINIVEVLDRNGFRLIDCSEEDYPSVKQYIKEFIESYKEKIAEKNHQEAIKNCLLDDVSELKISNRYITILKKLGINKVSELLGYTRTDLMNTKQLGVKGINAITDALIKHDITIKGDGIYTCSDCDAKFSAPISLELVTYCPTCTAKKERIESIEQLEVRLSDIQYAGFTSIQSGFDIYANIKNLTDTLIKVKLKDFYVVSKGRQHSPKFYLTGYSFDEELIMPKSIKSVAKIWDLDDFNGAKLEEGDEAFISLFIPSTNKTLMYKFVLDEFSDWVIDDFFEN